MESFNLTYNAIIFFAAFTALLLALGIDIKKYRFSTLGTVLALSFGVVLLILFGLRTRDIGTDTVMYYWQYKNYLKVEEDTDFMMKYVFTGLNQISDKPTLFFFVMALLYLSTFLAAFYYYSKTMQVNLFLLLYSFVSLFFFPAMGINTIRQGVSLGFFALAFSQYCTEPKKILKKSVVIPLVLSVGFHLTGLIPIVLFFMVLLFNKVKLHYYYGVYLLTLILSAFSISILSFKDYLGFLSFDERRSGYLDVDKWSQLYSIGFKPQFVAFNSIFLILFIYIRKFLYSSEEYSQLLKYYLLSSSLFFMVFQLPFSDRWGIMSWVAIPFLLSPLFKVGGNKRWASVTVLFLTCIFIFFLSYQNQ
jgi:hypothetical protein